MRRCAVFSVGVQYLLNGYTAPLFVPAPFQLSPVDKENTLSKLNAILYVSSQVRIRRAYSAL